MKIIVKGFNYISEPLIKKFIPSFAEEKETTVVTAKMVIYWSRKKSDKKRRDTD